MVHVIFRISMRNLNRICMLSLHLIKLILIAVETGTRIRFNNENGTGRALNNTNRDRMTVSIVIFGVSF